MRCGFVLPGGPAPVQLEQAVLAEQSGWDAVFVWEGSYAIDPWALLSAIAVRTERIRLGTMLTPLPWRRPWKLAGQVVTLDQLSAGRAILAVGLGAVDPALGNPGEVTDLRTRAELLDEGIDLITGLWAGELEHHGAHHDIDLRALRDAFVVPEPVQQPRIPIWCVGAWPHTKSMRRILRCDGLLPYAPGQELTPELVAAMIAWLDANGGRRPGFDVVCEGETPADDAAKAADIIRPWAEAGGTWWLETRWSATEGAPDELVERIAAGPPRLR